MPDARDDTPDTGPAVLSMGFRPFFPLAAIWAAVALPLSVEMIRGRAALPTAFDAIAWHYHEMLFGYVAAAIAGFLLTAIPNWTGRPPIRGLPLLGLVLVWVAGRAAVALSARIGAGPAMAIDLLFVAALLAIAAREIMAARNWRNLPVIGILGLFFLGNAFSHLQAMGWPIGTDLARRLPLALVIMLILLIGGRIVPNFTRNWLKARGAAALPAPFDHVDRAGLAAAVVALIAWIFWPQAPATGVLALLGAVLSLVRIGRWRGAATLREPLLAVLHIGYLWIPIGLLLLAASSVFIAVPQTAGVHALTAGAIGTMTLAVMSRATFGHSGRPLTAGPGLTGAFALVNAAALLRIVASLWPALYMPFLSAAMFFWLAAFILFLAICGPPALRRAPGS